MEDADGLKLGKLYDELSSRKADVEVIKEPVSADGSLIYEIYDTDNVSVSHIVPITNDKKISYYCLTRDEFVDSTGKFKSSLPEEKMQEISDALNITIEKYNDEKIDYEQVVRQNAVNIIILILTSQLVLLIYTFSRIKLNAIKKLNGISPIRMIVFSLRELIVMEVIGAACISVGHLAYCVANNAVCKAYFVGLAFVMILDFVVTVVQLLLTQISIRFIDVSAMIKNQTYSPIWSILMNVVKIVFIFAITLSVTLLSVQIDGYKSTLNKIDDYRELARYFTSNGYNSDEYDKVFYDDESIDEMAESARKLYEDNYDKAILIDANIPNIAGDAYYDMYDTGFTELNDSYSDNYVVVNKNYYYQYMNLLDADGHEITDLGDKTVVLVPEEYKSDANVAEFCQDQYSLMMNYDNIYEDREYDACDDIAVIYVRDNQITSLLNEYTLESGKEISNSIVFIDNGEFDGTWYLYELSNGRLAFEFDDRNEYKMMLEKYGISQLLSAATMLTPLTEDIRYYEFLMYQSSVFVMLFIVTLFMIIYFSEYMEIMVNRKRYALKYLMGFSKPRIVVPQLLQNMLIIILAVIISALGAKNSVMIASVILDIVFWVFMMRRLVINNVSDVMKGE